MRVTFGLIPFNNHASIRTRLERELFPTLANYPQGEFEIIIVDNSTHEDHELLGFLRANCPVPFRYHWNEGQNLQYSHAMNQIVDLARHPQFVYLCSSHGRMFDPSWLGDILEPLADPTVGMCGTVLGSIEYSHLGFDGEGVPCVHVQGGLFAANTDVLRRFPWSAWFPHAYSDIWISWKLQREGYRLVDVPTIRSLWGHVPEPERYKYAHDSSDRG